MCAVVLTGASADAGCSSASSPTSPTAASTDQISLTPVPQTAEWPASTPDAEGLDPDVLTDLLRRLRRGEFGSVSSVLVARNDRLVLEEYNGWSSTRAHTMQSVTKSVTSLIVGIAVAEGRLKVTDRVMPLAAAWGPIANMDEWKAAMTVGDLLTMRSGFDWTEWPYAGSPLERLNTCRCDWLRLILDWGMREAPGTRWEYVSGAPILLAGVIGFVTGQRFDDYAADRLFRPLGTVGERWALYSSAPPGLPHTGGGLFMRPRDMAKIGSLVLNEGAWQGVQVVPPEWIRESTRRIVSSPPAGWPHPVDYGYLWWLMSLADPMNARPEPGDVIVAAGAQGQWIMVAPRHRLVMTATGETDNDFGRMYGPNFFYTHVLASVRR
jgi:CubicO group peptidase (beta-lactamase class C family)